jgi:hypothetical protein
MAARGKFYGEKLRHIRYNCRTMSPQEILTLLTSGGYGLAAIEGFVIWKLYGQVRESEDKRIALMERVATLAVTIPEAVSKLHDAVEKLERRTP